MDFKFFIGIDVSKQTLDIGLLIEESGAISHLQVGNNDEGIIEMLNWLQSHQDFAIKDALFCMEHTGIYNYPLLQFINHHSAMVWVENLIQIKKSMGLQRGKNDKVDSIRIAQYAYQAKEKVKLWQPARKVVDRLKYLTNLRERLLETKKRLQTPVEELMKIGNKDMANLLKKSMSKTIKGLEKDLQSIEAQMKDVIEGDDELKKLFNLVTSVVGIGFVTAINLIICTNEFTSFNNYRQLACYSGVAPFEHRSGISVRGRTKVSHMANKKIKRYLHMASLSCVKLDTELKACYERKVLSGKSKMSVLNAVRNKLLARVFAVVKRGIPYQKNNYKNQLVLS